MDALGSLLTAEIIKSLGEGNLTKFAGYIAIFFLLWVQLRGVRNEITKLNATISQSFADGEARFGNIEKTQIQFEHRLTVLEDKALGGET